MRNIGGFYLLASHGLFSCDISFENSGSGNAILGKDFNHFQVLFCSSIDLIQKILFWHMPMQIICSFLHVDC